MKKELRYPLFFAAVTLAYFYSGFSGRLLACGDGISEFFPLMTDINSMLKKGVLPLWNHHMFAGFPQMASMQPAVLYPPHRLLALLPPVTAFNVSVLLHAFFAGYFTFLYARLLVGSGLPALMAGTVFGFMGFMQFNAAIIPILDTAAWLPLILYFFERLRITLRIEYALSASIAIALQFYAGHPQTVFQSQVLAACYVFFSALISERGRRGEFLVRGVFSVMLGLLLSLPQIAATYELSDLALRQTLSYEKFSQFSFPLHMLPTMVLPYLWLYDGVYFGPKTLVSYPQGFAGVLTIVVAALVFVRFRRSGAHAKFWGVIAAASLLLALGDSLPLLHGALFRVPVFGLFRAPVRHFLEFDFAVSILLAIGLARIIKGDLKFLRTVVKSLFGVGALIAVSVPLLRLLGGRAGIQSVELLQKHVSFGSHAVYAPLLFIALYASVLLLLSRSSRGRVLLLAALPIILLFEVAYIRGDKERFCWPEPNVLKQEDWIFSYLGGRPERVAFVSSEEFQNRPLQWGINTLNSYDPLILRDLSDMLDMEGIGYSHSWNELIEYNSMLSMLNTKYLVVPYKEVPRVEGVKGKFENGLYVPPIGPNLPPDKDYRPVYERLFGRSGQMIYLNKNFQPRAFSVRELVEVKDIDEVLGMLYAFRVDPRRQAMLSGDDLSAIGRREFSTGEVEIKDYGATRVTLRTNFPGKGFVVLADQFYPGWKAYLDGRPAAIYRTNGVLRGVVVAGGEHELIFRYLPVRIYVSMAVSSAAFLITVIIIFWRKTARGKGIHLGNNTRL